MTDHLRLSREAALDLDRLQLTDDVHGQAGALLRHVSTRPGEPSARIETLTGAAEVMGAMRGAYESCRDAVVGVRCADSLPAGDEALLYDLSLLRRGVRASFLYHHRVRVDLADKRRIGRLVTAGAELRTDHYLPGSLAIFDRRVAFMFESNAEGGSAAPQRATVVRDVGTIEFLRATFERAWHGATPYDVGEAGYHGVLDDIYRSIARMLADGLTDEVMARKLGLSVRTVRRHIAGLFRHLGAVSRFQAGARAASLGLLES
jgi:DNA-binding CsgD family transcriptional regulator